MSEQEPDEGTELVCEQGAGTLCVFGRQLKRFRVRAGIERPDFGAATGYSASTIASFEQGRRIPPPRFIDKADELLDAGGVLQEMKEEVEKAQFPAFFRDAAKQEAGAAEVHAYDTHVINGLLQTEEYARCVLSLRRPLLHDAVIDQLVTARMARQEIFCRWPAPMMSFVIEEAALLRPIGGEGVWRGELEHILLAGQKRNVDIQVMPIKRQEHAGLAGPFKLIETSQGRRVAYAEAQMGSHLYTDRKTVRVLEAKYGIIRAQALTPSESMAFVEGLLVDT
ncbi:MULTISPECIES: helix-turn-helix domain-containing protein [Streptomyces]|uniref:helix-turn-helix domain-containing protein n=1 Tax=Streptomyces TaxID=1883 RepID=UPI001D135DB3|nr:MULTISPECIES: helix-turn-helix transcriptional regulator [Streptomyces]MCC3650247.1 helix-turn-helix domain-containing protein [Streptomyces sp. S07_1.15]WSQ74751.1 helix-turn-helix domain-containing protein [Streptomyces xinghaiensis]